MKKYTVIVLSILFLVFLGLWLRNSKVSRQKPVTRVSSEAQQQSPTTTTVLSASSNISTSAVTPNNSGNPPINAQPNSHLDKAKMMMMELEAENKKAINVYGKVIDQYNQPVSQAEIDASVMVNVGFENSADNNYVTTTDMQGQFKFIDLHGARFGFAPKKDGYEYNPKLYLNWWNNYKPDPDNPAIFVMWKLKGAEPMTHAKFGAWIPYDGTPVKIDLFTGKKSEEGDLQVSLTRSPLQVRRGVDHFDWEVQIQVIGGGLVESHDPYPYEAPEKGYQSTFEFGQTKDAPDWTRKLVQTFYIRNAKGDYGRINIDLTTDSDRPEGTGLGVESWMNPSGSRNLEFDRKEEISLGKP